MDGLKLLDKNISSTPSLNPTFEVADIGPALAHNYSVLLGKLEQLAAFSETNRDRINQPFPILSSSHNGATEIEYSRVISDIWIGIVLTLLILSTVFFICSCFLYHKFQKWKHSYQTHSTELPEISRRNADIDLESLPSYTICSGLPTYDDALDQFRKYGIILQPPSAIKIFEDHKQRERAKFSESTEPCGPAENDDTISVTSTCTCGANNSSGEANDPRLYEQSFPTAVPNVIELNPDQLQILSQKRLSIQIALNNGLGLNNSIRRSSARNSRINLFREVSRNNLLRSHEIPSIIHRAASQQTLHQDQLLAQRFENTQHRGSLS